MLNKKQEKALQKRFDAVCNDPDKAEWLPDAETETHYIWRYIYARRKVELVLDKRTNSITVCKY